MQFQAGDVNMNVVGNVLGTGGVSTTFDSYDTNVPAIFELDSAADVSATSLFRHGNFDAVHGMTTWDPTVTSHDLPASLYLHGMPAWWPAQTPWPWVGPDVTPMTGTLPAKARSDAM